MIEEHIGTRDAAHARSHAQKFFTKLMKYIENKERGQPIQNAELYYEILQRKVEKPNKKKGKLGLPIQDDQEDPDASQSGYEADDIDYEKIQGKIFQVEKDPIAVQKKLAYKNI